MYNPYLTSNRTDYMPTNQNVFILFQASHDSYIYSAQRERFDVSFDPHRKGKLLFYSAFNILIRKIILHLIPSSPQVDMTLRSISNNQSSDPNSIEWKHKLQGNEWDLQMKGSVQNIRGYYSFQLINNIRRKKDLKNKDLMVPSHWGHPRICPVLYCTKQKIITEKEKMKNWFSITSAFNIAKEQNTNSYYLMMSWLILVS